MKDLKIAVAGHGAMGKPLLGRLQEEGFPVEFSFTRGGVFFGKDQYPSFGDTPIKTIDDVAHVLDQFVEDSGGIDVMFLAIPSGPWELPLINYCISKKIYAILFCKHALAYHYHELRPNRHMLGANATVGGRTLVLPWVRMQYLEQRKFVLYAYLNASANYYMHDASEEGSATGSYEDAVALSLAEPGSTSYASFLNGEIGGDLPKKISILMNDAVLTGPFLTPNTFDKYRALNEQDVQERTQPTNNNRYLVRIENIGLQPCFERAAPGVLYAKLGSFTVNGGFYDRSRDTSISKWMKGGKSNGVQIRFAGNHGYVGTVETAGLGAGKATIDAAMCDLYEFQRARTGKLLEASWPFESESSLNVEDYVRELIEPLAGQA